MIDYVGVNGSALQRAGTMDEVCDAVFFLASDKAKFLTGVLLPVDGGVSIKGGRTEY